MSRPIDGRPCPVCGRIYKLTKAGRTRQHSVPDPANPVRRIICAGTDLRPEEQLPLVPGAE